MTRAVAGAELGTLLGWMSTRVLGQYDLLVPDGAEWYAEDRNGDRDSRRREGDERAHQERDLDGPYDAVRDLPDSDA